jgi:L-2-hydroxycarboxylate dehydrogenase (NAD+)
MVESAPLPAGTMRMPANRLREFVTAAFVAAGVPPDDAALVGDVLVSADLRGIRSHGAARMSYFLVRLERGVINTKPDLRYTAGSPTTGVLDADHAIGIVAAARAMDEALGMAERHGSGFVSVARSSHFGYAGYWANEAMRRGCVGISMSNGGRRVAPTFGASSVFGTNPLSVTMPGGGGTDFYLDMATSAVAVGKVETALREDRPIPAGWLGPSAGKAHLDGNGVLAFDIPLLPLGGEVETGGHKGYGLSMMVELLCGALNGTTLESRIAGAAGTGRTMMGHFMGAIRLDGFRPPEDVHAAMAETFDLVRSSEKAPGHERIFISGEPESLAEAENRRLGVAVTPPVLAQMRRWNDHYGLGFDLGSGEP